MNVNCRHVRALLSAYLDSELTGYEMIAIRDHLAACPACSEERCSLARVRAVLRALPQADPRPDWAAEMSSRIGYCTLPFWERLRLALGRDIAASPQLSRRLVSGAMLSAIGIFLVAAVIDPTGSPNSAQIVGAAIDASATPRANQSYGPVLLYDQAMYEPSIRFLDPRIYPADLTGNRTLLSPGSPGRPQTGYNNVSLISLASSGNRDASAR